MTHTVSTARDALDAAVAALAAVGVDTPRLDAEVLLGFALGLDRTELVADGRLGVSPSAARRFGEYVRRRLAREPVAYIIGTKCFRHIELAVDRRVLIPRPETELLVEIALELGVGARVHEVGTGSGAVALALVQERPDLRVSASDVSEEVVVVARQNAERLGLELELEAACGLPDGEFDLVLANLPYVATGEWQELEPEIREYEPRAALLAGFDGLEAIRSLIGDAPKGMRLALEHAPGQADAVRRLLDEAETRRDLAGRERVSIGRIP